jgi:predicted dehydrogenase
MARRSDECRAMIEEAEKHSVSLCVCHNWLFSQSILKGGQLLKDRKVSFSAVRMRNARAEYQKTPIWVKDGKEGGILWEIGTHAVYLQRYFLDKIDRVFAISRKTMGPADDNFLVLLHTESDALGVIDISYTSTSSEYGCQIDTKTGEQIEIDLASEYCSMKRARSPKGFATEWTDKSLHDLKRLLKMRLGYAGKYLSSGGARFFRRTHHTLIENYVRSINEHVAPPVPPREGVETVEILEAIEASIDKGAAMRV